MKRIFLVFVLCAFAQLLFAQSETISLWPEEAPNSKKSNLIEHVDSTDIIRISKVVNPTIEVFLPAKEHSTGKAVLICPGGGYGILAYDHEGTNIARMLNENGIVGVVLKYRLPEDESNFLPHLSPLIDAKKGMELIRANAGRWGIDQNQVGIMGFSAGGHLASTLGTHFEAKNRPDFMVLIYPVITMKSDLTHQGSRFNLLGDSPADELIDLYSNELQVSEDTPPAYIIHSEDDTVVPVENSINFYRSLKEKGIEAEMHIYPYGGHGYSLASERGRLSQWPQLMISWLNEL
ncbi:MAG: alpha/beta hydrolase [Cyclobacteriaceae bacterium]